LKRVLAIGIDAAEPSLVRAELDSLPNLARILNGGTWSRVVSPAHIGSGTVWPTFFTASDPEQHGVHSEWSWHADSMTLRWHDDGALEPFWKSVRSAGVIDVPFAPFGFVKNGFELSEWGSHDRIHGRTRTMPAMDLPRHPFASGGNDVDIDSCIEGARLRGEVAARLLRETSPDLAIIVFPEVHHVSHPMWKDRHAIVNVLREVDQQIRVIEQAFGEGAILVFSLHGMRASRGIASLLQPLLIERGYAKRASGVSARSLFAAAKKRAPRFLKKLYYRTLPSSATTLLAQTTMLPQYDWLRTRAFSLPSDQHGWIRINLRGRESAGVVDPRDYDALCDELEAMLRATGSVDGVIRTGAGSSAIPDLVVHWNESAEMPLASGKVQTGQHAADGFLVARGIDAAETVNARDFASMML
jgi:predicted AlkP superfamily phosphohydrolase/phosphomutase